MTKRNNGLPIWPFIFIIIAAVVVMYGSNLQAPEEFCEGFAKSETYKSKFECCLDCNKINRTYFKSESVNQGLFGGNDYNCYCLKDNEIMQVY